MKNKKQQLKKLEREIVMEFPPLKIIEQAAEKKISHLIRLNYVECCYFCELMQPDLEDNTWKCIEHNVTFGWCNTNSALSNMVEFVCDDFVKP